MKPQSPCMMCPDRYVGCHGKCEKYTEFKVRLDEYNRNEAMQRRDARTLSKAHITLIRHRHYADKMKKG